MSPWLQIAPAASPAVETRSVTDSEWLRVARPGGSAGEAAAVAADARLSHNWLRAFVCLVGGLSMTWGMLAYAAIPTPRVVDYVLVSETSISPSVTESVFRVVVKNSGDVATNVRASLVDSPKVLRISTQALNWGRVGRRRTAPSTDTLVIRHNSARILTARRLKRQLRWRFTFDCAPVLLDGPENMPVHEAARDFYNGNAISEQEISHDPVTGQEVVRTQVQIVMHDSATVGDVNRVLAGIGGGITSMLGGLPHLAVRIPDPGTIDGLNALIENVRSDAAVADVLPVFMDDADELPSNPPYQISPPGRLPYIAHHLAVGSHAVWNARSAFRSSPNSGTDPALLVRDFFGKGPITGKLWGLSVPGAGGDSGFTPSDEDRWPEADNLGGAHGYHVLSIIGASFGGTVEKGDLVTGFLPQRGVLNQVVDHIKAKTCGVFFSCLEKTSLDLDHVEFSLLADLAKKGNVVVNHSFGDPCSDAQTNRKNAEIIYSKLTKLKLIDRVNLVDRVLFVQSAGNDPKCPAAARMGGWKRLLIGDPTSPGEEKAFLDNGLVVENFVSERASANRRFYPTGRYKGIPTGRYKGLGGSTANGHVAGIGAVTEIKMPFKGSRVAGAVEGFVDPTGKTGEKVGTSMAAPQVAGLAHLLWRVAPNLTAKEVAETIRCTAVDPATRSGPMQIPLPKVAGVCDPAKLRGGVVDAYAAILTADNLKAPYSWGNAPVREALLDVANKNDEERPDGEFDEHDLLTFIKRYDAARLARARGVLQAATYSRYDLNGDGYDAGVDSTGAPLRAFFDLDNSGMPAPGTETDGVRFKLTDPMRDGRAIKIEANPIRFDETRGLSDYAILIYYAYSDLYKGDPVSRSILLIDGFPEVGIRLSSVAINLKSPSLPPGWSYANPVLLSGISAWSRDYPVKTFPGSWFGNNGGCETGGPVFSAVPASRHAKFYGVLQTQSVPYAVSDGVSPRLNYSSFLATSGDLAWINATVRGARNPGQIGALDWEYQTRLYLGDPRNPGGRAATQTLNIGRVPNSGAFISVTGNLVGNVFDTNLIFVPTGPDIPEWHDCRG